MPTASAPCCPSRAAATTPRPRSISAETTGSSTWCSATPPSRSSSRGDDARRGPFWLRHVLGDQVGQQTRGAQGQQVVGSGHDHHGAAGDALGDALAALAHHRVVEVANRKHRRDPDLAEPRVGGRVGPLMVAQPEERRDRAADLGLTGPVSAPPGPRPQPQTHPPPPPPPPPPLPHPP